MSSYLVIQRHTGIGDSTIDDMTTEAVALGGMPVDLDD